MWTAMIQVLSVHGRHSEALHLFEEMNRVGVNPNEYTYTLILRIIGDTTNLDEGKRIHALLKVSVATYGLFCLFLTTNRANSDPFMTFRSLLTRVFRCMQSVVILTKLDKYPSSFHPFVIAFTTIYIRRIQDEFASQK